MLAYTAGDTDVPLLEETLLLIEHHPGLVPGTVIERKFPKRPAVARADADKLRQVFWNICDNALKAMPAGGKLSAEIMDTEDVEIRIQLADSGMGLSAARREKIFEPFQAGFTNGTGLGLPIARQIAAAHGGELVVASRQGRGTTVQLRLPARSGA